MKKVLTFLSLVLALTLLCPCVPAFAAEEKSGGCGENLRWELSADGTLNISGTGRMADYSAEKSPWADDSRIRSLIVENGAETISIGAFEGCSALEEIRLPATVKSIGDRAFSGCASVKEIDLPKDLTNIGAEAFSGSALTRIEIPGKVLYISPRAFSGCNKLETIATVDLNASYRCEDGVLIIVTDQSIVCYPEGKKAGEYAIPESVRGIGDGAFLNNTHLEKLTVPKSVRFLGGLVFAGCENLHEIDLPDTLSSVASNAFADQASGYDCTGAIRFLPNGNNPSGCVWNGCLDGTAWEKAQPDGVLYAGRVAYGYKGADAKTVNELTIADGTIAIADGAFTSLEGLHRISVPDSVKKIGKLNEYEFPVAESVFANPASIEIVCPENSYAAYFAKQTFMRTELTPRQPVPGADGTLVPADGEPVRVDHDARSVFLLPGTSVDAFFGMLKNEAPRLNAFDGTPGHEWITDDALMQTGGYVDTLDENDEALMNYTVIVLFDVNCDGKVSSADARLALRAAAKVETLNDAQLRAATRGASDKVTAGDARSILRVGARLETVSF